MGDHGKSHEAGVRDEVPDCGRSVASDIHRGIYEALGKPAGDADYEVEDTRDPREALD